jgi:hypothetical protein
MERHRKPGDMLADLLSGTYKVSAADADVSEYANSGDALGYKAVADQEINRLDVRS